MDCSTPGLPVHHQLPKFTQTHVHQSATPSNHLVLCRPLLCLPSIFPSIKDFSNESALHIRWAKNWSFSLTISPSNEYSELISFRIDWFDFLAVQETLKSFSPLAQFKSINYSAFSLLMVQLSHPYMTTGKTIALTRQTFVGKVMFLLFNMLSTGEGNGNSFQYSRLGNPRSERPDGLPSIVLQDLDTT